MTAARGTTNRNARGSSTDRAARRAWLVQAYRADSDLPTAEQSAMWPGAHEITFGHGVPSCRCYRCGMLLTAETVTVDRIKPGCEGGTYRRTNIRPACADCNSETGGLLGAARRRAAG